MSFSSINTSFPCKHGGGWRVRSWVQDLQLQGARNLPIIIVIKKKEVEKAIGIELGQHKW